MAMRPVYASDIYAVGATCLYLLTGKSPKAIEVDINTGELLWEKLVKVSPQFAKVLKTMLEVSVRHRYKSAQEVIQPQTDQQGHGNPDDNGGQPA